MADSRRFRIIATLSPPFSLRLRYAFHFRHDAFIFAATLRCCHGYMPPYADSCHLFSFSSLSAPRFPSIASGYAAAGFRLMPFSICFRHFRDASAESAFSFSTASRHLTPPAFRFHYFQPRRRRLPPPLAIALRRLIFRYFIFIADFFITPLD